jgi:hypothetical protein
LKESITSGAGFSVLIFNFQFLHFSRY